jgi:hypothetical protein
MAEPMKMEVSENSQAPKAAKVRRRSRARARPRTCFSAAAHPPPPPPPRPPPLQAKVATKPKAALGDANAVKGGKGGKSIEETYQKLSQLEHILLRPDTYIGSTEKQSATMWVHDGERMVQRTIAYAPGLFKIFDEILVNAADNKVRDASMDTLRVDIDVAKGEIRVLNTGAGVPVEVHKAEGVYVPELIFGHLLTSSNYDDAEKKVTGGRNGYGAKLANIFSTRFVVETADGRRKRRYKQTFRKNMTVRGEPVIVDCPATENWTRVTFAPDLERFGMEELEADTGALDCWGSGPRASCCCARRPATSLAPAPDSPAAHHTLPPNSRSRAPAQARLRHGRPPRQGRQGLPRRRAPQGQGLRLVRGSLPRPQGRRGRAATRLRAPLRPLGGLLRGLGRPVPAGLLRQRDLHVQGRHARELRRGPGRQARVRGARAVVRWWR